VISVSQDFYPLCELTDVDEKIPSFAVNTVQLGITNRRIIAE